MNGKAQTAIMVLIGVVAVVGVVGVILSHDNAIQILGFVGIIEASLLGRLQQIWSDKKVEVAVAEVKEVKAVLIENPPATAAQLAVVVEKVEEVHRTTNGLTAALAAAKLAQGLSEGREEGRQERRGTP